jgi:hypothetical protein
MPEITRGPMPHASTNLSRLLAWSNCACALLVVQSDGWERYGERATLCFALGWLEGQQTAESKFASCGRADGLSKR